MIYRVCLQVQYASECKVPNEGEKSKPILGSKATPSPPKQSVKFKNQVWHEITKKLAKKCLDASSL